MTSSYGNPILQKSPLLETASPPATIILQQFFLNKDTTLCLQALTTCPSWFLPSSPQLGLLPSVSSMLGYTKADSVKTETLSKYTLSLKTYFLRLICYQGVDSHSHSHIHQIQTLLWFHAWAQSIIFNCLLIISTAIWMPHCHSNRWHQAPFPTGSDLHRTWEWYFSSPSHIELKIFLHPLALLFHIFCSPTSSITLWQLLSFEMFVTAIAITILTTLIPGKCKRKTLNKMKVLLKTKLNILRIGSF